MHFLIHQLNASQFHLTKISESTFSFCSELKTIKIPSNTKLQTIERNAFFNSSIEQIFIPSSVTELEEGWCNQTSKLNRISVCKNNHFFYSYDDKFIIGKSNENEIFNVLVFCVRDIEKVKVPFFIEKIGPFAFNKCCKLKEFSVDQNSKLQIIDKNGFSHSSIEKISIPHHITQINDFAFYTCKRLRKVIFPLNSELSKLGKETFSYSSIESIQIPFEINEIERNCFDFCDKLQIIEFTECPKLKFINKNMFMGCVKTVVMIPFKLSKRLNLTTF